MSYQSLARKYRPRIFSDLVGQESAALALRNAISLHREPSAVIFSGVRGVGKTTTARLYAKALNCTERREGEPCDQCPSCLSINEGTHEDVLEIDGASHNGVDEVRGLQELLAYVNQRSAYKVFIIDEVHMLSINAFNALLKTLEEPPPQVVFILATTNLQKVPQTIIGRCQTFHLQKIALAAIIERLKNILAREGLTYEERALYLVAKEGQGSMRDALTFLDQVIALGHGAVTSESLEQFLTQVSGEIYLELLDALVKRDGKRCIALVEQLDQRGVGFAPALEELASLTRHGFIIRDLCKDALNLAALGLDEHEQTMLTALAGQASPLELNRLFRILLRCKQELDGSSLDRFVVENNLLEWCLDPGFPTTAQLLQFAQSAATATSVAPAPAASAPAAPTRPNPRHSAPTAPREPIRAQQSQTTPNEISSKATMPGSWPELIEQWKKMQPLAARKLEEVKLLSYSPAKIEVAVSPLGIVGPQLLRPEYQQKVTLYFAQQFGFTGQFRAIASDETTSASTSLLDEKTQALKLKQAQTLDAARNHPLTKALVEKLGGKVLAAQLKGDRDSLC